MIEIMPDMPEGTIGFRVAGPVSRADMAEVVVSRLREIIDRDGELRVLVLIESRFSEEPSALWEGMKPTPSSASVIGRRGGASPT